MTTKSQIIDHTLLAPTATRAEVRKLCREAVEANFFSVCINPFWVAEAAACTAGSPVKVCTVIGFPLGASTSTIKAAETREAVASGATEVDMVLNVGLALMGEWDQVEQDIKTVVDAAEGALVKVILEICLLNDEQIVEASRRAVSAGADYVKTSTGFSTGGATPDAVRLMRATVGPTVGVKASGGIRTAADFDQMVAAGASRVGASAGLTIIKEGV